MDSLVATTATTTTTPNTTTATVQRLANNKQHRREQTLWLDTSSLLHPPPPVPGPVTDPFAATAFVLPELRTIAREVLDRQLCSVVRDALWATGQVVGVVGELRVRLRHLETFDTWKHSKLP
jgi:hypothetical protein